MSYRSPSDDKQFEAFEIGYALIFLFLSFRLVEATAYP